MILPGIPDFFSRRPLLDAGRVLLSGRAWSGRGGVERVEAAVDEEWADAILASNVGEFACCG